MTPPTVSASVSSSFSSLLLPQSKPHRLGYCNVRRVTPKFNSFLLARASLSTSRFPPGSRVVVKNLSSATCEIDLREEFSTFGEVAEVKLVKHEERGSRNAHAFIQYTRLDDAFLALEHMDGEVFDGRMIYVDVARPGRRIFGDYPTASGPPELSSPSAVTLNEQDECWY